MKKMLIIGLVLVFGLAMVGCPTEDDNSGNDNGGSGNGGGGIVPSDLRGTWMATETTALNTSDGKEVTTYTYTFSTNSLVIYEESNYPDTGAETYWSKQTCNVTTCNPVDNDIAASKELFPKGWRIAVQITKAEDSNNRNYDAWIGREDVASFIINNPKNRMIINGNGLILTKQ